MARAARAETEAELRAAKAEAETAATQLQAAASRETGAAAELTRYKEMAAVALDEKDGEPPRHSRHATPFAV